MLNERERAGISAILRRMPLHDLRSLAETITNRLVRLETSDEAVTAIVTYASSALDVLSRRKMKKEYVFQYLHECGHNVSTTLDKIAIVRATLQYWESKESQGDMLMEEEDHLVDQTIAVAANTGTGSGTVSNASTASNSFQSELETMAHQFVTWFYPLLNNCHVANPNVEDNFGPHHFWRDCRMKIAAPHYEQLAEGDETVARALLTLIGDSQLYFNPFDARQGIRCQCDPHGLVLVLVGGSVHRGDDGVGIFEQQFGLIRDPGSNNKWKIKFVELQLSGKDVAVNTLDAASTDYHHLALGSGTTTSSPS